MNRRELLKSIPALAATGIAVASINEGHLSVGKAYELKPDTKYLFVFARGYGQPDYEALRSLGVQGAIQFVDDPETDLKIYKVD